MTRRALCLAAAVAGTVATPQPGPAAEADFFGRPFSFPDGFVLEVAASPPLVERPIEASFDDRGRLYVTESSGSNEPVKEQLRKKAHRVVRLEDTNGDGVFDRRTVFADGLMFPEGVLWLDGVVLVAACPEIWKLADTNDDGVADSREVWFDGKTLTGCANDLHGPYRGPDGWIYWCKGGFAEHEATIAGRAVKTKASHVYRARPDGSGAEIVSSGGMDNPVGLAWSAEGELILSGTFFQHPGGGKRDGLIHAVRGGVWGKEQDFLDALPRTGPLLPIMTHQGPSAACGIERFEGDILCCQFNMRKISRHKLIPHGATFRTEDSDLLFSTHPDFHPTDVLNAPDGSVLIVDTGGWYKLCCPTAQLAKPNVPGAIYRLRKESAAPEARPAPPPRATDSDDITGLTAGLRSSDLHVRRAAAEALGQWPARQAAAGSAAETSASRRAIVQPLLEASAAPDVDRFLEHSITYALIEGGDPHAVRDGFLREKNARARKVALLAVNESDADLLEPTAVVEILNADDAGLREAALFVIRRHPGWTPQLTPSIAAQLESPKAGGEALKAVLEVLAVSSDNRQFIADQLSNTRNPQARRALLDAMAQFRGKKLPEEWAAPLKKILESTDRDSVAAALGILRRTPPEDRAAWSGCLREIAANEKFERSVRLRASSLLPASALDERAFELISAAIDEGASGKHRALAVEVLTQSRLAGPQFAAAARWLREAGPVDRPEFLKVFKNCADDEIGGEVASALEQPGVLKSLPPELVAECLGAFPEGVRGRVKKAGEAGTAASNDQQKRLAEFEQMLGTGDPQRGSLVYESAKAACFTCHQIGYKGGQIGPDLTRIGSIRTPRDVLESIVFPSSSFVRSYEPVQVTRKDDTMLLGIVRDQGTDSITLVSSAALPEQRIPNADVREIKPGALSIMPAGYDLLFTPQELADLVAFLASLR